VASPNAADQPSLWVIAGANGSGKSSAYGKLAIDAPQGSVWIINPDALSKRIADHEGLPLNPEANLEAVKRIEAWLYASVNAHQTVGVETVLSSAKYRALIERAHEQGFRVRLIYVYLDSARLNIERVRTRVAKGGHDVVEDKILSRRTRSFEQLSWFFQHADQVEIFDNSGAEPTLVLRKVNRSVDLYRLPIPEVQEALKAVHPAFESAFSAWSND
jgi:predicted ABC-type ATPase